MCSIFDTLAIIGKLVSDHVYAIEDGCLRNLDYEPHKRGKNWMATVKPNRAAPGGLDREFWRHGSGPWYKAPHINVGDVIEMAGDYYTTRGRAQRDRRYVLVVRVDADSMVGLYLGDTAPSGRAVETAKGKHIQVTT